MTVFGVTATSIVRSALFICRISLIVIGCWVAVGLPQCFAFDYFEHRYLGDQGFKLAAKWLNARPKSEYIYTGEKFKVALAKIFPPPLEDAELLHAWPLSFGDFAALAGDHTYDAEKLTTMILEMQNSSKENKIVEVTRGHLRDRCVWLNPEGYSWKNQQSSNHQINGSEYNHAFLIPDDPFHQRGTADCFGDLRIGPALSAIESVALSPEKDYPLRIGSKGFVSDRLERAEFEALPDFVGLAQRNRSHFAPFSWATYAEYHRKALDYARHYRKAMASASDNRTDFAKLEPLRSALVYEGFAQHFLHDSFSAGHIGTEYGSCFLFDAWFTFLPPLLCHPSKGLLQHRHDYLNGVGLLVTAELPTPPGVAQIGRWNLVPQWTAFGDGHLLIPQAQEHLAIVTYIAAHSIYEVLQAASPLGGKIELPREPMRAIRIGDFPLPAKNDLRTEESRHEEVCFYDPVSSTSCSDKPRERLTSYNSDMNMRYEGWKLLATYGESWGRYNRYNTDLSLLKKQDTFGGGSVELGYIRSVGARLVPNYLGVGAFMVPGIETSLFVSFGWWKQPFYGYSSFLKEFHLNWLDELWLGMRFTGGARIQDSLTQDNRTLKTVAYGEIGAVADLMYVIRPPFALYVRCNFWDSVIRGIGEPNGSTRWQNDFLFGGGGALTFGLAVDLANIGK